MVAAPTMLIVATLVVPQPNVKLCGLVTLYVGNPAVDETVNVEQLEQPLTLLIIQCVKTPTPPGTNIAVGVFAVRVPPVGEIH